MKSTEKKKRNGPSDLTLSPIEEWRQAPCHQKEPAIRQNAGAQTSGRGGGRGGRHCNEAGGSSKEKNDRGKKKKGAYLA